MEWNCLGPEHNLNLSSNIKDVCLFICLTEVMMNKAECIFIKMLEKIENQRTNVTDWEMY